MGAKIHTSAKICTGVEDIFLVHFCWAQIAPGLASKGPLGPTVSIERGGGTLFPAYEMLLPRMHLYYFGGKPCFQPMWYSSLAYTFIFVPRKTLFPAYEILLPRMHLYYFGGNPVSGLCGIIHNQPFKSVFISVAIFLNTQIFSAQQLYNPFLPPSASS